ncbi:MAG: hypothetical protein VYD64_11785 [Pseudomonadota bacterium]|nr:hypothetical protein [Pseudomonadota bacterium]
MTVRPFTQRIIDRATATLRKQIDDDPYCGPEEEWPKETPRPDWELSWTDDPKHVMGVRATQIRRHRAHMLFALVATGMGIPAFCGLTRCRRKAYCAGRSYATTGFCSGLTDRYPHCWHALGECGLPEFQAALRTALDENREAAREDENG